MRVRLALVIVFLVLSASTAWAAPPIWESSYGSLIPDDPNDPNDADGLAGEDDDQLPVTLGFSFPFEGYNYTTVYVGSNGCVQLGSDGDDDNIDYDLWSYFEEFYDDDDLGTGDPDPIICPFDSDLDNTTTGLVWFNDFGDRAVFTWDEVGTNAEETHLSTFQLQLLDDGTIIFGYNGVLDGAGESVAADTFGGSLDGGIVVGISLADGTFATPEQNPWDLNGGPFSAGDTIYERWCYDEDDSCGEGGSDLGYAGLMNSNWDLEMQNVIFTPLAGGGFAVGNQVLTIPTASEVGLIALLLLLAVTGTWILRR